MPEVRYLHALYGCNPGADRISGPLRSVGAFQSMAEEIGGSNDLVAVYITKNSPSDLARGYRGKIAAFARILEYESGKGPYDYGFFRKYASKGRKWSIGAPAQWFVVPKRKAVFLTDLESNRNTLNTLYGFFRNGYPVDVTNEFQDLKRKLDSCYEKMEEFAFNQY